MSLPNPSTLESFVRHERSAWQWLPGCETTPDNPYTAEFLDGLFKRLPQESHPERWDDVLSAWRSAAIGKDGRCASNLVLLSLYKGRVTAAVCDQGSHARRTQLGGLGHLRVFLYVLGGAVSGLASDGQRPPDVLVILDLSDRADTPVPGDVPKLASTTGACAASLPVPISLKGYDHNMLASRWYARDARPRWPQVPWARKTRTLAWRGTARPYTGCLVVAARGASARCELHAASSLERCACYAARPPPRASELALAAACVGGGGGGGGGGPRGSSASWPHPRTAAVRVAANASGAVGGGGASGSSSGGHGASGGAVGAGGGGAAAVGGGGGGGGGGERLLDVAFAPCSSHDCESKSGEGFDAAELLAGATLPVRRGWPFADNANFSAVLEMDGFGWQAALLAKLTLGSVVVTRPGSRRRPQASLAPAHLTRTHNTHTPTLKTSSAMMPHPHAPLHSRR